MPYATLAQIELAAGGADRLLELADWNGDDAVDSEVIAFAQLQADALIDGHSRMRFAALVDGSGDAVDTAVMLAASEAVYRLKVSRGQNSDQDDEAATARLEIYKAIAAGDFRPSEPAPTKSTAVGSAWVERDDSTAAVSRCTLKGFW